MELPELPPTALRFEVGLARTGERLDYTAGQMRAYALEAVRAERERCARICEERAGDHEDDHASDGDERWLVYAKHARRLAAAIRAQGSKT